MSSPQYWGADSPTQGAYQENEVMEIFKPAGFKSVLFQLADKRRVMSGQSLTVPHYQNLSMPSSLALSEDQPIPLSKLTVTAKTISMAEKGRALEVTSVNVNRSPWDILQGHKDALETMMKRELEDVISTALQTMPIKYVPTGVASQTVTTNGTAGAAALSNINIYHLRYISNYLQDSLRVPFHRSFGSYVGIFRGNAMMSIQSDPEFLEIHQGLPEAFSSLGKVGKIADITLIPHNDQQVLDNAIGTNNDVSEGFVIGDQAVLFGFIEQLKLIYDFGMGKAQDFGRRKYIAMLGDYGAGLYSDSANADLVRGLHVSSNV